MQIRKIDGEFFISFKDIVKYCNDNTNCIGELKEEVDDLLNKITKSIDDYKDEK